MSPIDPWEAFNDNHHHDERITSTISRIVSDLGLFIALDGGIDGIVHLSDLDWTIPSEESIAQYSVGDRIKLVILSIQPEMQRISLGIKQLTSNPRSDRRDEPPAPVPIKPKKPKPPNPLSEAAEFDKQ